MLRHLFLRPEIISRLIFSYSEEKTYYVQATHQQRARRALPEEIIRQLFVLSLIHDYKYPEDRIHLEWIIQMGREKKRADIVVLDENGNVLIILEIKVEPDQHAMAQLKSYMAITGAKYGALITAYKMECIKMHSTREVFSIRDIPIFMEVVNPTANNSLLDVPPNTTVGIALDVKGYPWDGRIHASSRAKVSDGTWRYKRGSTDDAIAKVELELREKAMHTQTQVVSNADIQNFTLDVDSIGIETSPEISVAQEESTPQSDNAKNDTAKLSLQQLIGIEQFERVSKSHANITIKGIALRLPLAELDSYKLLRMKFLKEGIVLKQDVKQNDWFVLFNKMLDSNPVPVNAELNEIELSPEISADQEESKTQTEDATKDTPILSLQQLIGIEQFVRLSSSHANITVKGITLRLPLVELDSYKSLRKKFLKQGIVLRQDVKQPEWFALFKKMLESNPVPEYAIDNDIDDRVRQIVINAIDSCRKGFCGGFVSSYELEHLLRDSKMDRIMPRNRRQEMLRTLGYIQHPALRKGRVSSNIPGTLDRPQIYIKQNHPTVHYKNNGEIVAAYVKAQQGVPAGLVEGG